METIKREPYVKPDLYIEKYELNTAIAACSFKHINSTDSNCFAEGTGGFAGWVLFDQVPCTASESDIEGLCYQNGEEGFNTWIS